MNPQQIIKMQTALDSLNATANQMLKVMEALPKATKEVAKATEDLTENVEEAEKKLTIFGNAAEFLTKPNSGFAKFRRFMYGFGFQGFFRGLNKAISVFEQLDIVIRKFPGMKGFGGTKSLFSKLAPSKEDMKKIEEFNSRVKGAQTAQNTYFKRSNTARLRMRGINLDPDAAERQMMGRRKAERTLKSSRMRAISKAITGMGSFKQEAEEGKKKKAEQKEKAKNFIKKFNKSEIGKIMKLVKKFVVKAAIVFLGVIFKVVGIVILAYLAFKAFGPSILEGLKAAWEAIKVVGKIALAGLMIAFDGVKDVFNAFFGGGDLEMLIDGLLKILGGMLLFALGVAVTLLSAVIYGAVMLLWDAITRGWTWLTTGWTDLAASFKKIITLIAVVVGGIIFFLSMTWVAAIVAAVVGGLIYWLGSKLGKLLGFKSAGGPVTTPMTLVGERGPELVSLPRSSTVRTAQDTKRVMGGGGGNTFNITINARDTSNAELRRIADEIGRMVNSKVNRSVSSRTLG